MKIAKYGTVLATIADCDKEAALPLIRRFYNLGFNIEATRGTACLLYTSKRFAIPSLKMPWLDIPLPMMAIISPTAIRPNPLANRPGRAMKRIHSFGPRLEA